MMLRAIPLILAFLPFLPPSIALPAGEGAPTRPNVLWLIAEDFGQHLGCYGAKEVTTPNLDRLAAEGVRYDRFYTTAPVCSPSRSAFMTGMYQTTIGAHHHRSHRGDGYKLPAGVRVITDRLRAAGYFTANVVRLPERCGFKGTGKTDWNFTYEGKPFDSNDWADLRTHEPFYAQLNFHETHRKFNGPRLADPTKVEIPPYYPDHPVTREDWARYLDAASELDRKVGVVLAELEGDGIASRTVVAFFGDNGEAHVRGKQFCYESGLRVPLIIRWPKGVPAPEGYRSGTASARLLAAIDLTATTLDIAGVRKPEGIEGQVFLGPRADPPREFVFGARDRCDETTFRFRTVRDARYRYIRNFTPDRPFLQENRYKETQYPVWNLLKALDAEGKLTPAQKFLTAPNLPAEELYDLEKDPHEVRNLAGSVDPEHRSALERLRAAVERWILETDDKGRFPEPQEAEPQPREEGPEGKRRAKRASP
jgi:arylsulfatase A-like enzyme